MLPLPPHFDPASVERIWRTPYQKRAEEARQWAYKHEVQPISKDNIRVGLLLIDCQNTFCLPEFELFVGGRSGRGAVEDSTRLCEFIYRHLGTITEIIPTLDTHTTMQIFHPVFWVDAQGKHPVGGQTIISMDELERRVWRINPAVADAFKEGTDLETHALHYVRRLTDGGKYPLMIWPYHAMLGGIGHALVSAIEEAVFFHSIARNSPVHFEIKGDNPLTENYSVLRPEVTDGPDGRPLALKNAALIERLLAFDAVVIAGQAKSHCVAWTVDDLLTEIRTRDAALAEKVYLLEDCTSPVVVPDIIDFTDQADAAFQRFADAGMKVVKADTPMGAWAGMKF